MATVTGLTASRMQEIIDASLVDADVVGNDLQFTTHDGTIINAGNVRGPQGIQGAYGSPPLVAALPSSPVNGQEILYQNAAMAASGILWHLRYNTAETGPYKWQVMYAGPIREKIAATESRASASQGDLATVGPSITLPLAGDYQLDYGAMLQSLVAGTYEIYAALSLNAVASLAGSTLVSVSTAQFGGTSVTGEHRLTNAAAGDFVRMRYSSQGGFNSQYHSRWLRATPLRVG